MKDIENIDRNKLGLDKIKSNGEAYFSLFDKHIPRFKNNGFGKNILLAGISNAACMIKMCTLNKTASYHIIDQQILTKVLPLLEPSLKLKFYDESEMYNIFRGIDMKFDCTIMNPPYEGNGNLYGKITLEAKKHAKDVVCLSPYLNYLSNSQKKSNHDVANELEKYLESFEFADPKMFDAAFDKKLCIFHFSDNCKHNVFFDQIYWSQFKNPDLTKSIIEKMSAYPSHCYDKIINKKEFDKHAFKIAFSGSRGNSHAGNLSWDWTTLFDDDKMSNFTIGSSQKGDLMGIPFNTKNECENFVKYANTDIFEYAILVQKNSFATDKWLFKKIPFLPIYKKEWTEEDIQNELNLTDKEMDYIHEEMKDFGWKAKNK